MKQENTNVISIRLIYIIFAIILIIGITIGAKNKISFDKLNVAEVKIEEEIDPITTIDRTNKEKVVSRSVNLNRENGENDFEQGNGGDNLENANVQVIEEENKKNIEENEELDLVTEEDNELDQLIKEYDDEKNKVYKSISEITISKGMDLTERTNVSRDDFITLMAGVKADKSGFFEENAGLIYDLCEEYSLNEIFFCGLISAESGWEIASNHRKTHNYISLMSNGKLKSFSSVESGLREAARVLHDNYLTPGGKFYYGSTLSGMKKRFCPASSTWVDLVYGRMCQII